MAILPVRSTDQPQRWAAAPAGFMGVGGVAFVVFGWSSHAALRWVWPPTFLALVVWMAIRCRQQLRSRSRWLLYPVLAVLVLVSAGGVYEAVSEAADANTYPMPGELIDVGGHGLHLSCTGSGSPTVVLQAGGGEMSSAFGWITPAVARDTRVCVYDRAGHGRSEPADVPQDAARIRHRPAHAAGARARPRTLCAHRPFVRRIICAPVRRPLPRRRHRAGAAGLHRTCIDGAG